MAAKRSDPCPVCARTFANLGGLASHLKNSKDTAHQAHRSGPRGDPQDQAPPTLEGPRIQAPEEPTPTDPPGHTQAAQVVEKPTQQEGGAPISVSFTPPKLVQPLLPPGAPLQREAGPAPGMNHASPIGPMDPEPAPSIPLAPLLNGTTAVALNGFFLRGEGDGELSAQEVASTGFGEAAEKALLHYFPDMSLDHPLAGVIASGAALSLLVASKKDFDADPEPRPARSPRSAPIMRAPADPAPIADPMVDLTPDLEPAVGDQFPIEKDDDVGQAKTGGVDPYWAAIQAHAGGSPVE